MSDAANYQRFILLSEREDLNRRQGSSWPSTDMHYQLGSSSFACGNGTGSGSSRGQHKIEASESWDDRGASVQDFGKGPEFTRPAVHEPSQVSPALVTYSSGAQRSVRPPPALSLQGQWNPMPGNLETDTNLSIGGLSTRLGLSDVPALAGHRFTGSSLEFSVGRSGMSAGNNSNFYPNRISSQAINISEYTLGRGTGQVADEGGGRVSPLVGRSTELAVSGAYHIARNAVAERTIGDPSVGVAVTTSLSIDRQGRDGQALIRRSCCDFNALTDSLMASGNNGQGPLGEESTCSSDSPCFLNAAAVGRAQVREACTLRGSFLGNSPSSSSSSNNNVMSSPRASACKRKSCTSSLLFSSSCRSGSPHSSGSQEGYGVRSMEGSNTGRRSSSTMVGCVSAFDVVASASAVVAKRCTDTPVAASAVDQQRTRKSSTAQDGESSGNGRSMKSSSGAAGASSSGPRRVHCGGTVRQMDHQTTKTQPPFARAVRRAIPALQSDAWCSRGVSLADCFSGADFVNQSASARVQPTEQLMASGGGRRSESPLAAISRSGSTLPSRRNDHFVGSSYGEGLSYRYMSSSNRNILSGTGGSSRGIGTESRLRVRNYINSSADSINSFGSVAAQGQPSVNVQGLPHSGSGSGSSPSRLPPQTPAVRPRQNLTSLHVSMLSSSMLPSPSFGLPPSRLPPSPPSATSSLSPAIEMLPAGSNVFQGSLLPRSSPSPSGTSSLSSAMEMLPAGSNIFQGSLMPRASPSDGRSERGFGSASESRLGFPFRGLQLTDGEHQPRLVAEGLADILLALDRVERDEDLTYEQLLMLEGTLLFGGMGLHDQHSDLRLDVDNMSYEELLALEERIGNVSTGLTMDVVNKRLKNARYCYQAALIAGSQESDVKCSVCQEEYEDGDELGKIDCGHSYHIGCIKQWLLQKNQCPICKASALS